MTGITSNVSTSFKPNDVIRPQSSCYVAYLYVQFKNGQRDNESAGHWHEPVAGSRLIFLQIALASPPYMLCWAVSPQSRSEYSIRILGVTVGRHGPEISAYWPTSLQRLAVSTVALWMLLKSAGGWWITSGDFLKGRAVISGEGHVSIELSCRILVPSALEHRTVTMFEMGWALMYRRRICLLHAPVTTIGPAYITIFTVTGSRTGL